MNTKEKIQAALFYIIIIAFFVALYSTGVLGWIEAASRVFPLIGIY